MKKKEKKIDYQTSKLSVPRIGILNFGDSEVRK
jgi:hypothetical protein